MSCGISISVTPGNLTCMWLLSGDMTMMFVLAVLPLNVSLIDGFFRGFLAASYSLHNLELYLFFAIMCGDNVYYHNMDEPRTVHIDHILDMV